MTTHREELLRKLKGTSQVVEKAIVEEGLSKREVKEALLSQGFPEAEADNILRNYKEEAAEVGIVSGSVATVGEIPLILPNHCIFFGNVIWDTHSGFERDVGSHWMYQVRVRGIYEMTLNMITDIAQEFRLMLNHSRNLIGSGERGTTNWTGRLTADLTPGDVLSVAAIGDIQDRPMASIIAAPASTFHIVRR